MHFTTDEEIKESDNVINTVQKTLFIADTQFMKVIGNTLSTNKKILATTDQQLRIKSTIRESNSNSMNYGRVLSIISQIPQSFVEEYCKAGGIDGIELEYESCHSRFYCGDEVDFSDRCISQCEVCNDAIKLKLTPNNEVITHLIEERMIPIDRVKNHLYNCVGFFSEKHDIIIDGRDLSNWIEQNL
jgi:hypothetical protein